MITTMNLGVICKEISNSSCHLQNIEKLAFLHIKEGTDIYWYY